MKTLVSFIFSFLFSISLFGDELRNSFLAENPQLSGEVRIKSADTKCANDDIYTTFEVECTETNSYYLSAWIDIPVINGNLPQYKVEINGKLNENTLKPNRDNWQSLPLTDSNNTVSKVDLKKGINTISIISKAPEIPNVEFIKASSSILNTKIDDTKYKNYLNQVKTDALQKEGVSSFLPDSVKYSLKGTSGETYTYKLDLNVAYTFFSDFNFNAGQTVTINTTSSSYEHVIEFFNLTNPANYSWTGMAGSGNGTLSATLPVSGTYRLRVRAYRQGTSSLVNINVTNGVSNYSYPNRPVAGNGMTISGSYSTNFFACKVPSGNRVVLWLEDVGIPGKIRAFAEGGGTYSGYNWGGSARVTTSLTNLGAGLVSAFSSNSPIFKCDLYLGVRPGQTNVPFLSANNSFISAPANENYNCIGWTIDKTNSNEWPLNYSSSYYDPNPLTAFDKLYAAYGYTRSGATRDNAGIALWERGDEYRRTIEHASIRKNAKTNKPHGFEWESKRGASERVMHTWDELQGGVYGRIAYYYKPTNNRMAISEAIENETEFSPFSAFTLSSLKGQIPTVKLTVFESKYADWKNTWKDPEIAVHSNPKMYAQSKEYAELVKICSQFGKASWPLLIERFVGGDFFVINLLEDLTFAENRKIMDEVKSNALKAKLGNSHLPSLSSNYINYCMKLLESQQSEIQKSIKSFEMAITDSQDASVSVAGQEITFTLSSDIITSGSIAIYDIYGMLVYEKNTNITVGSQQINIPGSNFKKGVYIIKIIIGNKLISKKINI